MSDLDLDSSLHEHAAFLRAIARRLIADPATVDDLVQETFVRALRHRPAYLQSVRAWLATVVRNVFRDHRAAEAARRRREHDAARGRNDGRGDDPLGVDMLSRALRGLPPDYRHALELRYYAQKAPPEIAKELGVPVATVKTRLHRGLELLRADLLLRTGGKDRMRMVLGPLAGVPALPVAVAAAAGAFSTKNAIAGAAVAAVLASVVVVPAMVGSRGEVAPAGDGRAAVPMAANANASPGRAASEAPPDGGSLPRAAARESQAGTQRRGRVVYAGSGDPVPFCRLRVRDHSASEHVVADRDGRFVTSAFFDADAEVQADGVNDPGHGRPMPPFARTPGAPRLRPAPPPEPPVDDAAMPWHRLDTFGPVDDAVVPVAQGPTYFLATRLPPGCSVGDVMVGLSHEQVTDIAWVRDHTGWTTPLREVPGEPGRFWCRFPHALATNLHRASLHLFTADGSWRGTGSVDRVEGLQREPVAIDFAGAGIVTGVVRTADGMPRGEQFVTLVRTSAATLDRTSARTDAEGRFLITLALPGQALLEVTGEDVEPCRERVEVVANATIAKDLMVAARPIGGSIAGTITTTSGDEFSCSVLLTSRNDASIWRTADIDWSGPGPDGRRTATWSFAKVPIVECDVTIDAFEPCGIPVRRHRVVPPVERVAFHVEDRLPRHEVEFAADFGGAPTGAKDWMLELRSEHGWSVRMPGDATGKVRLPLPAGQQFSWRLAGPGVRARSGTATVLAAPMRVAIDTDPGFSCRVSCMDIANFYSPSGVEVFADGVSVGATDGNGELAIDLPRAPSSLTLDPKVWRVSRDPAHRSDIDASNGRFRFDADSPGVLHLYVERIW